MANKPEHIEHLNKKHPGIDAGKILNIFEKHLLSVQLGMFESNHTLTMPLSSDLNKTILVAVLDEYLNGKVLPEKQKKVIDHIETECHNDIYEESVSSEVSEEIINTCEKKLNYTKCVIWTAADKGCAECEFYKPLNQYK